MSSGPLEPLNPTVGLSPSTTSVPALPIGPCPLPPRHHILQAGLPAAALSSTLLKLKLALQKFIKTLEIKCGHWSLALELSLQLSSASIGLLEEVLLCALPRTLLLNFQFPFQKLLFQSSHHIMPGCSPPPTADGHLASGAGLFMHP